MVRSVETTSVAVHAIHSGYTSRTAIQAFCAIFKRESVDLAPLELDAAEPSHGLWSCRTDGASEVAVYALSDAGQHAHDALVARAGALLEVATLATKAELAVA
jgi:hypothetical protein